MTDSTTALPKMDGNVNPAPRITARDRAIKKILSGLMWFNANMCSASGDTPSNAITPVDRLRPLDVLNFRFSLLEGGEVIIVSARVIEREDSCNL